FYRDTLGMTIGGGGENLGDEQDHLNNVQGAHLRITTLRANQNGIKVELLEYLTPATGRPYPGDAHANDLFHWQTTVQTSDAALATTVLRESGVQFVSQGFIEHAAPELGIDMAGLVRDPDGHAIQLVAP